MKKEDERFFFDDDPIQKMNECGHNFFEKKNGRPTKKRGKKKQDFIKSKRANIAVDPLLTNPLNSCTKLQIRTT